MVVLDAQVKVCTQKEVGKRIIWTLYMHPTTTLTSIL